MVAKTMISKTRPTRLDIAKRRRQAAERAASEAQERWKVRDKPQNPPEHGGRKGPDPARYGDWENNGIATDF
jgi:hypothetical protein